MNYQNKTRQIKTKQLVVQIESDFRTRSLDIGIWRRFYYHFRLKKGRLNLQTDF